MLVRMDERNRDSCAKSQQVAVKQISQSGHRLLKERSSKRQEMLNCQQLSRICCRQNISSLPLDSFSSSQCIDWLEHCATACCDFHTAILVYIYVLNSLRPPKLKSFEVLLQQWDWPCSVHDACQSITPVQKEEANTHADFLTCAVHL